MAEAEFTQHESHVARDVPLYVAVARSKSRQQSRAVRESGQRRRRLAGLLIGAFAAGAGISLLTEPDRAFEFRELPALLGSAPWQSSPAQATVVKNNQTAAPVAASALPPPAAITVAHPAAPEQKRLTPPAVLPETHAPDENVTTTAYTSPAPKLTEEKTETLPAPPATRGDKRR